MRLCKEFIDIVGHKPIVQWFENAIRKDILPQVLLIDGVAGIGKSSIAKIAACEIAYKTCPDKMVEAKKSIIEDNKNTDAVKLFNMSNLKDKEAILQVRSELSIGLSSTGRKAVIMDEAHGMARDEQDSLLTAFEALPLGVYIFICTTDISNLEDAFVSRCLRRSLKSLTEQEIASLIRARVKDNNLTFELRESLAVKLISTYTGREPRRALNLLDSFDKGSKVSNLELETFFNLGEAMDIFILIRYMYDGDILGGLKYIRDMDLANTFIGSLLEMTRVAYGDITTLLDVTTMSAFKEIVKRDDGEAILGFTIEVSTAPRLTRNLLSGLFLKWCSIKPSIPRRYSESEIASSNVSNINKMMEDTELVETGMELDKSDEILSLDELFEGADEISYDGGTYEKFRTDLGI